MSDKSQKVARQISWLTVVISVFSMAIFGPPLVWAAHNAPDPSADVAYISAHAMVLFTLTISFQHLVVYNGLFQGALHSISNRLREVLNRS